VTKLLTGLTVVSFSYALPMSLVFTWRVMLCAIYRVPMPPLPWLTFAALAMALLGSGYLGTRKLS